MVGKYSGIGNLESMEEAANYQAFLTGLISQVGSHAATRTILDFGAGSGTYARRARALGYSVLCIETDPTLSARLRSMSFATTSLEAVPSASQHAVYSLNVLEHIEDDIEVLGELFRVTAPGGHLLLYVPAFPILYSEMDLQVGHVRRYRRAELITKTSNSGFSVDGCNYADSLGFLAALAYRFIPRTSGQLGVTSVRRYDRLVFPLSRRLDRLAQRWAGKNLVLTAHRCVES